MAVWPLLALVVIVAALVVLVRPLARRPRRKKIGYAVGVVVYVAVTLLLDAVPGDDRDLPWHLVAAVLAVYVARRVIGLPVISSAVRVTR